MLIHGLTGKSSNNSVPDQEIEYIKDFKKQYPVISISQFRDVYHEDIIWNRNKQDDVKKYNLKVRSKSFFQQLYKEKDGNHLSNINVLSQIEIFIHFVFPCLELVC